jgi:chromosomal replication initiation ATPase DnaA
LQQVVSADVVTRWFRSIRVLNYADKTLILLSENIIYQYWIEKNYLSQLRSSASRILGESVFILFHSQESGVPSCVPDQAKPKSQAEVFLPYLLQREGQQMVSIELIQRRVAETYNLRLPDMKRKRPPVDIVSPRMVAMYLSRRLTRASLDEVGEAFGGLNYRMVMYAEFMIEREMETDEKLRRIVTYLGEKLVATQVCLLPS